MELKLKHEPICVNEVIYDNKLEQGVELDYLLPDYYPSIFKILKCKISPKITSERVHNNKIVIDGVANIKIIYVSEGKFCVHSINCKQVFTKTVDIQNGCDKAAIQAFVKCDYSNCRVISERRLDIRASLVIKTIVTAPKSLQIVTKAKGMGVQVNRKNIVACSERLYENKEFSIVEELELGSAKPNIAEILSCQAVVCSNEMKIIPNKVMAKGEILLHTLYLSDSDDNKLEIMDHSIPFNQILDIQGIDDEYRLIGRFDIISIETIIKENGDGASSIFEVEFTIRVCCEASKNAETKLINDIYSTKYIVNKSSKEIKLDELVSMLNEVCMLKNSIKLEHNELNCIYDISCEFVDESSLCNTSGLCITGNLNISILARDNENMPIIIEKVIPSEMNINSCCNEDVMINPIISVANVSYSLLGSGEIEIRTEIRVCGNIYKVNRYNVITQLDLKQDELKIRDTNDVIKLYFCNKGESIWDIAKRFNTSVEAISIENSIENERIAEKGMLLIPIIE